MSEKEQVIVKSKGKKGRKKATDAVWLSRIADRSNISLEDARKVWDVEKELIAEAMAKGGPGELFIPGFGRFYRLEHKGHPLNLRNVNDGNRTQIGEYSLIKFRVDSVFRDRVVGTPLWDQQSVGKP